MILRYKKEIILIFIPLIYGYSAFLFVILVAPGLSQIVFGAFWFWIGMRFAKIEGSNWRNFLVGNSIWLFSFLIFVWQFILSNDESRNITLAVFGQLYAFSFIGAGVELLRPFTNSFHLTVIFINTYFIMLIVFSAGYMFEKRGGKNRWSSK